MVQFSQSRIPGLVQSRAPAMPAIDSVAGTIKSWIRRLFIGPPLSDGEDAQRIEEAVRLGAAHEGAVLQLFDSGSGARQARGAVAVLGRRNEVHRQRVVQIVGYLHVVA